jgi:hypothetical protein
MTKLDEMVLEGIKNRVREIYKNSFGLIPPIKFVRDFTGLGLKDSKEFVEEIVDNPMKIEIIGTRSQIGALVDYLKSKSCEENPEIPKIKNMTLNVDWVKED